MRKSRVRVRSRRGSTIAIMAVMLFGVLALAALAVDLASLRSARAEAQRAADAIALAGASAFRDLPEGSADRVPEAQKRALELARQEMVRAETLYVDNPVVSVSLESFGPVTTVVTEDVTLNIIPALDSQKVRAWVRRPGIGTFFAGTFGLPFGHVQAMATAWASNDGPVVDCLKPFVIPDMWYESDKTTQDVDGDDYMDPISTNPGNEQDGESWKYNPEDGDYYLPYNPDAPPDPQGRQQTGYGSPMRAAAGDYPGDVGLPLTLKPQTGAGNTKPAPERMGNAFWLLDFLPGVNVKDEVRDHCGTATIGDPVPYESGGNTSVRQAVDDLVQMDPGAYWDNETRTIQGSSYADWTESPRVVIVGLIDPIYWTATSKNDKPDPGSVFTNFARIFFLPIDRTGPPDNIQAIFLGTAPGGGGGPTGGPLVKVLQLIE